MMKFPGKSFHAVVGASLALFFVGGGAAQDALVLEEVIVTAQKRDQNVRDVAATVNVVSAATVNDYSIINFSDLERYTSGLALTKTNARNNTISLRGVTTDPEAGFSVNGVETYFNNAIQRYDTIFGGLYDIARVEVLRGPQGALQGRTAPAGSIQVHSAPANLNETEGYLRSLAGSNSATNFQGAISIPLIEDRLAVRLSGFLDQNDGEEVINRITENVQDQHANSTRLSVQWQPVEAFSANLVYQDIAQRVYDAKPIEGTRSTAYSVTPRTGPAAGMVTPIACDADALAGHDTRSCTTLTADDNAALASLDDYGDLDAQVFTANADWQFHDRHKFSYVFSYTKSRKESRQQNDRSFYLPLQNAFYANVLGVETDTDYLTHQGTTTKVKALTHELRFESNDNSVWNYMLGLYHSDQETSTAFESWQTIARYIPLGPFPPPTAMCPEGGACLDPIPPGASPLLPMGFPAYILTLNAYIEGVNFSSAGQIPVNSDTRAIFTHHSFQLTEQLVLEAALRYQEIEGYRRTDIEFGRYNQQDAITLAYAGYTATANLPAGTPQAMIDAVQAALDNPASAPIIEGAVAGVIAGAGGPTIAGTLAGIPMGFPIVGISSPHDRPEYDAVTGSLSLRFDINEAISTYASINTAYRPGGISIIPGQALPDSDLLYDEEDSIAYEIGFKSLLLNGRAQLNGALYYQTFDGFLGRITELEAEYPDEDPVQFPGGIVFNGDAEFYGIELDARFLLTENWSIGGGLNYSKAEWSEAQAPCNDRVAGEVVGRCDYDGRRVAGTPELSINLNSEYSYDFGDFEIFARANAKYNDGIVATAADRTNAAGVVVAAGETDGYTVIDLFLGVRGDSGGHRSWEASLWSKNLTDEDARTDLTNPGDNFDVVGDFSEVRRLQQRTHGATLSYYF